MNSVESPCIKNCSLDEQRICRGCFRHLDEIVAWRDADEDGRQRILDRVASRRGLREAVENTDRSLPA